MEIGMAAMTKTESPRTKAGRSTKLAKLIAGAKGVKGAAEHAVRAIV
jgi:hypothetical protein